VDYHPERGCDFLGIGGQVVDRTCAPAKNYEVQLSGTLNGRPVQMSALSGKAPVYGQGGFEFILAGELVAAQDTLEIQVLGQDGNPLSAPVTISTFANCSQNLILVNFWQSEGDSMYVAAACTATMEALHAMQTQAAGQTLTATVVPLEGQEP
jgi:hypothetical protein